MVDSVNDVLELGGYVSDHSTFGSWGTDFADLSNNSFDLVCDVDEISLGDWGIRVKDMVDSVNDVLELGGYVTDHSTFGSWGKDFADLSNDSLDLVGDVDEVSLGDWGVRVKDVVDSVDDVLELGGHVSDHSTFGSWAKDFADLSDDSLDLLGDVDEVSLCCWGKNFADLSNNSSNLLGDVGKLRSLGDWGVRVKDVVD